MSKKEPEQLQCKAMVTDRESSWGRECQCRKSATEGDYRDADHLAHWATERNIRETQAAVAAAERSVIDAAKDWHDIPRGLFSAVDALVKAERSLRESVDALSRPSEQPK